MMKRSNKTVKVSLAALAATTLLTAPSAFADQALQLKINAKPAIEAQHRGHDRHDDRYDESRNDRGKDGRNYTVLRECGSSGYRTSTCHFDVNFKIADARVHHRTSKASCDEGDEWGLRGNSMWVRDGCRAIFELSSTSFRDDRGHDRHNRYDGRYDGRHDDRRWDNDRRGGYNGISFRDQREAVQKCSIAADEAARSYRAFSAQYKREPIVEVGRAGRLRVTGVVQIHSRRGYENRGSLCVVNPNGYVQNFDFR